MAKAPAVATTDLGLVLGAGGCTSLGMLLNIFHRFLEVAAGEVNHVIIHVIADKDRPVKFVDYFFHIFVQPITRLAKTVSIS